MLQARPVSIRGGWPCQAGGADLSSAASTPPPPALPSPGSPAKPAPAPALAVAMAPTPAPTLPSSLPAAQLNSCPSDHMLEYCKTVTVQGVKGKIVSSMAGKKPSIAKRLAFASLGDKPSMVVGVNPEGGYPAGVQFYQIIVKVNNEQVLHSASLTEVIKKVQTALQLDNSVSLKMMHVSRYKLLFPLGAPAQQDPELSEAVKDIVKEANEERAIDEERNEAVEKANKEANEEGAIVEESNEAVEKAIKEATKEAVGENIEKEVAVEQAIKEASDEAAEDAFEEASKEVFEEAKNEAINETNAERISFAFDTDDIFRKFEVDFEGHFGTGYYQDADASSNIQHSKLTGQGYVNENYMGANQRAEVAGRSSHNWKVGHSHLSSLGPAHCRPR